MFFKKYKNSILIVAVSILAFFYLNQQLMPLVDAQNLSAGLAYLLIFPLIVLFGSVHLLRLIVLPFVYLLKKRRRNKLQAYYDQQYQEYY